MRYFVGIDLGGTNIKAGIVREDGKLLRKANMKTAVNEGDIRIVQDMAELTKDVMREQSLSVSDITAVGIGTPGVPNTEKGLLVFANNIPFRNTPMRNIFQEELNLPVFIENDANCAAMAECKAGAAKGTLHSVTVTIGTGLGSGVIINGQIYSGFNQAGVEFGHTTIVKDGFPCSCGRRGCLETYASATGLIRMTNEMAEKHPDSKLHDLMRRDEKISARHAFEAMKDGDPYAYELVQNYIEYISEGLANLINTFMPEILVIGGGVCHEGDTLLVPLIEKTMRKPLWGQGVKRTEIRLAELGNDAGIIGAAMFGMISSGSGSVYGD